MADGKAPSSATDVSEVHSSDVRAGCVATDPISVRAEANGEGAGSEVDVARGCGCECARENPPDVAARRSPTIAGASNSRTSSASVLSESDDVTVRGLDGSGGSEDPARARGEAMVELHYMLVEIPTKALTNLGNRDDFEAVKKDAGDRVRKLYDRWREEADVVGVLLQFETLTLATGRAISAFPHPRDVWPTSKDAEQRVADVPRSEPTAYVDSSDASAPRASLATSPCSAGVSAFAAAPSPTTNRARRARSSPPSRGCPPAPARAASPRGGSARPSGRPDR